MEERAIRTPKCIRLDRQQNPLGMGAKVQTLIYENSSEGDEVIYTDGSLGWHMCSSWQHTEQDRGEIMKEDSDAFALTTIQ